jgi:hypothetical protein
VRLGVGVMGVGVRVDVGVIGVGVGVGVRVGGRGVRVTVGVRVGTSATATGVDVPVAIGRRATGGTATGVPTGARRVRSKGGRVNTSGRSGAMVSLPASPSGRVGFGSIWESIPAGTSHARRGLTAT